MLVGKVEQSLRVWGLDGAGLIIAVSGGPDSVALLRALVALRDTAEHRPLVLAHLNHQLRREESDADETFVRELHRSLVAAGATGLELWCDRLDVAHEASVRRDNLEKVARDLRYAWLARIANERGIRLVATGHTASDQAETVLHRLLRGSGLRGLQGIAPRRPLTGQVEVVRPLLTVTRAEVLAYLQELRQAYRHDRSNLDVSRTRNRIRHELLPHLAQDYNPAISSTLCRLAEQATEAYRGEEALAAALLAQAELPRAGRLLILDCSTLATAARHVVREAFRLAWAREQWPAGGMGYHDWDRLAALVFQEAKAVDLPGGIRARRRQGVVQMGQK
jgi:tRNA(Ile)-lysidine synthase